MIGYDGGGYYEYEPIKHFEICCNCPYFYDNELETRFECLKPKEMGCGE